MLELSARCGGARILTWTHGDHTVQTPLVLARAAVHPRLPQGFGTLVRAGAALEPARPPVVAMAGGFHMEDPPEATGDVWAQITIDRPRRIMGQLSLRRPRAVQGGEEEDGRDAEPDSANAQTDPVVDAGEHLAVFAEAASCARDPAVLIPHLLAAREAAGPAKVFYAPGVGLVHQLALLTYAGIDAFDTLAVERATHDGLYLTPEGVFEAKTLNAALCACTVCATTSPKDLDHEALLEHNLLALDTERRVVTGHIHNGTLRELVEQRARAHPGTAAALRHLDRNWQQLAAQISLAPGKVLHATTQESLTRPDIERFRQRIRDDYLPPENADILLLLPCSAAKPYARSKSHSVFKRVLGDLHSASLVHEVIITSPLGIVPRELEHTWPAAHYDVPVTGVWDLEERRMIREQVQALLDKGAYRAVVAHLGDATYHLIADLLPDGHIQTGAPHPTDYAARDKLRSTLKDVTRGVSAPPWPKRRLADAKSLTSWQFGPEAAAALCDDAGDLSGRPPMMRIYAERGKKKTLATFVPDKGLFALTLDGARRLYDAGCAKSVEIDDFTPRGTLFAVGVVDADPRIIPGDEVVLTHKGELRGIGAAVATGHEMRGFARGACVEVRHHA